MPKRKMKETAMGGAGGTRLCRHTRKKQGYLIHAVKERPVLQVWKLVFVSRSIRQMAVAAGWGVHAIDILDAF